MNIIKSKPLSKLIFGICAGHDYAEALASHVGKTPNTVTRQLNKLEKKGFLDSKRLKKNNIKKYRINYEAISEAYFLWHKEYLQVQGVEATDYEVEYNKGKQYYMSLKNASGSKKNFFLSLAQEEASICLYGLITNNLEDLKSNQSFHERLESIFSWDVNQSLEGVFGDLRDTFDTISYFTNKRDVKQAFKFAFLSERSIISGHNKAMRQYIKINRVISSTPADITLYSLEEIFHFYEQRETYLSFIL